MKRRILAIMMAVIVCTMVAGCGSNTEATSAAPYEKSDGAAIPEDTDTANAAVTPYINEQGEVLTQAPNDDIVEEDDFGRPPEEELVPWDEMEDTAENIEEETEAVPGTGEEGIIVVQADWSDLYCLAYTIIAIDPENGDSHEVANFWLDSVFERTNPEFTIIPAIRYGRYANLYDQFSGDYTKTAATKTFANNGEVHAGWIDNQGNFFDVTEALGEQSQSDFDDPVSYHAVGFQGDTFIYVNPGNHGDPRYYGVSLDNLTSGASWEIDTADSMVFDSYAEWGWVGNCKRTCWIDENRFIVDDTNNGSRIATISERSLTTFLPATDSRYSWSAVTNAENTNVAFLSVSKSSTNGDVGIYIMPLDNSASPTRLETDFVPRFSLGGGNKVVKQLGTGGVCCYILEWR